MLIELQSTKSLVRASTLIELQSTKLLVEQQSTKTPYLRFIGEGSPPSSLTPPSPRGSSSNMSQDDDDFLDALINQNDEQNEEEEDGPLPVLRNFGSVRCLQELLELMIPGRVFLGGAVGGV